MTITITIDCDNAAFDGGNCGDEVRRILHELLGDSSPRKREFAQDFDGRKLRDLNGNTVGKVTVTA